MEHTSENSTDVDFAYQLVSPFFTRAQLKAFMVPPKPAIIEKVNKGGQQDYIPHEYIRALLDHYIGTGVWEMQATLHSTDKEIVQKWDNNKKEKTDRIAATAMVNVSLIIHARDGSDRTLVYSAVGSNTQYANVEQGFGAIIGNAISSAESLGLKRAASNLGRAFGFDLKAKIKRSDLPPSIPAIAAEINEAFEAKRMRLVKSDSSSGTAANDQAQTPAIERPSPASEQVANTAAATELAPGGTPGAQESTAASNSVEHNRKPSAAGAMPRQSETPPKNVERLMPPEDVSSPPQPAAQTPAAEATQTTASPSAEGQADWELSLVPSKFEEWIKCIQTMARRVNAMTNEREIQNFIRRNQKLIDKLPIIPESDGVRERHFPKRWANIVTKRYRELGLDVPENIQFKDAA